MHKIEPTVTRYVATVLKENNNAFWLSVAREEAADQALGLVLVLHLIEWESGASLMDQSKGEVRKNKAKHENDQELTKRTKNARKTHERANENGVFWRSESVLETYRYLTTSFLMWTLSKKWVTHMSCPFHLGFRLFQCGR